MPTEKNILLTEWARLEEKYGAKLIQIITHVGLTSEMRCDLEQFLRDAGHSVTKSTSKMELVDDVHCVMSRFEDESEDEDESEGIRVS